MKTNRIHRVNALLCGMAGLFSLLLAVMVGKLAVQFDLPPDEKALIPYLIAFCTVYGVICLFYAYCRFFWDREKNALLVFLRKWPVYVLALFAHGMSLIWVIPLLFGMTDLRLFIALPLGLLAFLNILCDAAPYLKKLAIWVKEALSHKIVRQ